MSENVLVVDDESDMLGFLKDLLSRVGGYSVTTASDGQQAVLHLDRGEFDLVLTDVRMPGLSGLELLRTVKERLPSTEVIVATGYADMETARACMREGAFDLIQKPFNKYDVLTALARAAERRRLLADTALYRASQAIFQNREAEQLPKVIVEVASRVMACDEAALLLPGTQGKLFVAHASSSKVPAEVLLELGEAVARGLSENQAPAFLSEIERDFRFADVSSRPEPRSSIVYPLVASERLVGLLNLHRMGNTRPFRRADLERASVLASQALLAIENVRLLRQAIAADRLATIGQVAAGVTHEINNPLSVVINNLEFARRCLQPLSSEPAAKEAQEALEDAEQGAERMLGIVRDMRSLSRVDQEMVAFDLNDAVRSAARIARAQVCSTAQLLLELPEPVQVRGSSGRLSQVFVNLLVNAAQAMGGRALEQCKIAVATHREGNRVVATVSDTGTGIAPEHLPRVFEPLFTTKGPEIGTGLGLALCREIMRAHHGDIEVESVLGKGTTFTLQLPGADFA